MPNWCENELTITGPAKDIATFRKWARNKKGEPDLSLGEADDTKWGLIVLDIKRKRELRYRFETGWSPPEEWLRAVASRYPKLYFYLSYIEPNMAFGGVMRGIDGEVTAYN